MICCKGCAFDFGWKPDDTSVPDECIGCTVIDGKPTNFKPKPKTNADRIRAMSDRKLAEFLASKFADIHAQCDFEKEPPTATQLRAIEHIYFCEWMQWLQQPAEGE